jgi:HK97 family phage portal protein
MKVTYSFGLGDIPRGLFAEPSHSGKSTSLETDLQLAAFWACTRVTAQACAAMPLPMYQEDANGGRVKIDHPLSYIINESPNADMTSLEYWESMVAWLCARGNAYSEIVREGNRIVALEFLPASCVEVCRDHNRELFYRFSDRGKLYELPPDKVFHVKGFGFGGDEGLNPVRYGSQIFGAATAAEESSGKLLGNGLMPSGVLKSQSELSETQRSDLNDILQKYVGSSKAGKVIVLEAGLDYEQLSLDPETMQLLETRRFSTEQICMFMGVPPIVIGHAAEGVTAWGTGIETIQLQWLATGLNPILKRIERRIRKQLLGPGSRGVYAEFNRDSLLQMDSTARANFISSAVQNGWMTRAEARRASNMRFIEGSDFLTAQTNLAPLDKLGTAIDARAAMRSALGMGQEQ